MPATSTSRVSTSTPRLSTAATHVDAAEWRNELPMVREYFESLGDKVPAALWEELDALEQRLSG